MCLNVSANFKIKVLIDAVLSLCGLQLSWLLQCVIVCVFKFKTNCHARFVIYSILVYFQPKYSCSSARQNTECCCNSTNNHLCQLCDNQLAILSRTLLRNSHFQCQIKLSEFSKAAMSSPQPSPPHATQLMVFFVVYVQYNDKLS